MRFFYNCRVSWVGNMYQSATGIPTWDLLFASQCHFPIGLDPDWQILCNFYLQTYGITLCGPSPKLKYLEGFWDPCHKYRYWVIGETHHCVVDRWSTISLRAQLGQTHLKICSIIQQLIAKGICSFGDSLILKTTSLYHVPYYSLKIYSHYRTTSSSMTNYLKIIPILKFFW